MEKLKPEITTLLIPMVREEAAARYFYEAVRTWALAQGYCGLQRQAKCFVHYHKHNLKETLAIFGYYNTTFDYPEIPAPESYFPALPNVIDAMYAQEEELNEQWNKVAKAIFPLNLNVHKCVEHIRCREQGFYEEVAEFDRKLKLLNDKNGLDLVYFDRKILRW